MNKKFNPHSKYFIYFLVSIIFSVHSCGQKSQKSNKDCNSNLIENIITHYNNERYTEVYNFSSEDFKKSITKDEFLTFLENVKKKSGNIVSFDDGDRFKGGYLYNLKFSNSTAQLLLKSNYSCEINYFLIRDLIRPNQSKLSLNLPFNGTWFTFWGGDSYEKNRHVKSKRQMGAFDFAIKDKNGKTFALDRSKNSNFYAWDKTIISPCDGTVLKAINDIPDNKPGELNPQNSHGNYIIMNCDSITDEFLALYHFRYKSVLVKSGQKVQKGQILGSCGNSGNSSEPHLHFHIQNSIEDETAIGLTARFKEIMVKKGSFNSEWGKVNDYSPIKGDYISNIKRKN